MVLCKHYFTYLIQVKNVTQKSFQLYVLVVFLQNFFEPNQHFFQIYESSLKLQRAKTKFSGNPDHNILELYNILVQVRFNTSKTELDIQYSKLGKRVGSRVAERLKTQDLRKLGNIRKISDLGRHEAQCPVSLQKIKLWQQQLKNTQKQVPALFLSSFTRSLFFFQIFCPRLYLFQWSAFVYQISFGKNIREEPYWVCCCPPCFCLQSDLHCQVGNRSCRAKSKGSLCSC